MIRKPIHSKALGRLVKAAAIFLTVFIWLTYRIYPPVPFSVRLMYLTVTLAAILLWASSSEVYWQEFRRPIVEMLDGETVGMKQVRGIVLVLLPCLAASLTWNALTKLPDEPVELRTVQPAPPRAFQLHGKEILLQITQNPYRVNRQGVYDAHCLTERLHDDRTGRSWERAIVSDAWHAEGDRYLEAAKEGGTSISRNACFVTVRT